MFAPVCSERKEWVWFEEQLAYDNARLRGSDRYGSNYLATPATLLPARELCAGSWPADDGDGSFQAGRFPEFW